MGHYSPEYDSIAETITRFAQYGDGQGKSFFLSGVSLNRDGNVRVQTENWGSYYRYTVVKDGVQKGVIGAEGVWEGIDATGVINAEGTRYYYADAVYNHESNSVGSPRLNIFDLTKPSDNGGFEHVEGSPLDLTEFGSMGTADLLLTPNEGHIIFNLGKGIGIYKLPPVN